MKLEGFAGEAEAEAAALEDQQRFAAYAADLTGALARIARRNELDMLGYLLDMARLEAQSAAGESWDGTPGIN